MKYNRPHATASWGTMGKDWEQGIDFQRLIQERLARAQAAIKHAGIGAVLCFNMDNIRYIPALYRNGRAISSIVLRCVRAKVRHFCGIRLRRPSDQFAVDAHGLARRSARCRAHCRRGCWFRTALRGR